MVTRHPVSFLFALLAMTTDMHVRSAGNPSCWEGTFNWDSCCHPHFGHGGNKQCWDPFFTHRKCCIGELVLGSSGSSSGVSLEMLVPTVPEPLGVRLQRWNVPASLISLWGWLEATLDWDSLLQEGHIVYLVSDLVGVSGIQDGQLRHVRSLDTLTASQIRGALFVPFFASDDDLHREVDSITKHGGTLQIFGFHPRPFSSSVRILDEQRSRYIWTDNSARLAIGKSLVATSQFDPAHINLDAHETICQILAATKSLAGSYVEIGVYNGVSASVALLYLRESGIKRDVFLYDTFDGFSYKEAYASPERGWAGTHSIAASPVDAIAIVRARLSPYESVFSALNIQEFNVLGSSSLPLEENHMIVAANVDVDLLEATEAALALVAPRIVVGGMVHCDDPSGTPQLAGALLGFERFLASPLGRSFVKLLLGTSYVLVRVATP